MPNLNPFMYGSMITDPERFVGRRAKLEFITSRLNGEQPQGSSIVGPRRMGKSSLLHYLIHPRDNETLCKAPGQHVVYFDAQKGECSTPDRFRVRSYSCCSPRMPSTQTCPRGANWRNSTRS